MKRYRPLAFDLDTRHHTLRMEISDTWEPGVQDVWRHNQEAVQAQLRSEFGDDDFEIKLRNFVDHGGIPLSVIAGHNAAFRQIRNAFVVSSYYPALTAACALGERILNQLVLGLREGFRSTAQYKKIYRQSSIDDWTLAIDTLEAWSVLRPETIVALRQLQGLRHRSIHYESGTIENARQHASTAITLLSVVVEKQFGLFSGQPWLFSVMGAAFIRKAYENDPFVKIAYLPNCALVGPLHCLQILPGRRTFLVLDDFPYEDREVTDHEFLQMYEEAPH